MNIFMDVTNACRSSQNTGMQRMTRKIFAELSRRVNVHPICWNSIGQFYTDLGESEFGFLTRPFETRGSSSSRPEWRGHDPISEFFRRLIRRRIHVDEQIGPEDVFLVPDIYRDTRRHGVPEFVKRTPARTIAIFHDATDLALTHVYGDREKKSRPYVESLADFDLVVCVSEEARNDLLHFWKKFERRPTEVRVELWPGELEGARASEPTGNSIAFVSSFHARKNHLGLLRAAEKLWIEGASFELQLVGRSTGSPFNKIVREIFKLKARGRPLHWLRHVDDETLLRVYRDCRFTVYPSLMEGYGLPIVESLLHGKPVVCGGNGALGEVARGGGCLIVDQTDDDALAVGIKTLLQDRELYARLCEEARARKFRTWSDYIDKFLTYLQPDNATVAVSN
jgi:glycosyltransferase involved in cell wall biosynthesis